MQALSQRHIFTMLMTFLATLFGAAFGMYELRGEADILTDVIKISALLAMASTIVSYTVWTLTHLRKNNVFRGGLAGLLTGLTIVQVPYFTAAFKTEVLRLYKSENLDLFMSVLASIPLALKRGMETFQIISKVSLAAVLSSVILGVIIVKIFPTQSGETPLNPKS